MQNLTLSTRYHTGHDLTDLQHGEILGWASLALRQGSVAESKPAFLDALNGLLASFRMHHAMEEQAMERCGYHDEARHVREHLAILRSLESLRARAALSPEPILVAQELRGFVKAWLRFHVAVHDACFATALLDRGYEAPVH